MPGRRGNEAQLVQQPNRVGLRPVFDDFAIHNSIDVDKRPLYALASRRGAHEKPLMGTLTRHAVNDFVTLGNKVVNGRVQIWERYEQHVEKQAGTGDAGWHSKRNSVIDDSRAEMG